MRRLIAFVVAIMLTLMAFTGVQAEDEPITLTYVNTLNDKAAVSLSSYGEIACVVELQKRTGIKLEIIDNANIDLLMASGNYPDLVYYNNWKQYDVLELIDNGFIVDLTDLMDDYAPNYMALLNQYPEAIPQVTVGGHHFGFAFLQLDSGLRAGGPIIREDWLEKLNLSAPVTIDDWHEILCAFRDEDPNGNGIADEIPLIAEKGQDLESIVSWAGAFGVIEGFCMKDGKVTYGPIEEGYREFLATMQQWYEEGLIDPDFASQDRTALSAKVTGDIGGAWIGRITGTLGNYLKARENDGTDFSLIGTPWAMTEDGHSYNLRSNMLTMTTGGGTVITTSNKHVEESMQMLDYIYSEEGNLLYNFGIEGESYTMVDGEPVYTDLIMNNPDGLSMSNALALYCTCNGDDACMQDIRYFKQTLVYPQQHKTIEAWSQSETSLLVPPINLTSAENAELNDIMTEIKTIVTEWTTKTIMGQISMDEFDTYVAKLYDLKIERAIEIENDAYERYVG